MVSELFDFNPEFAMLFWAHRRDLCPEFDQIFLLILCLAVISYGQAASATAHPALRVGIVGLVHGHVYGFLDQSRHSPEIEIVGIAEPDQQLLTDGAAQLWV